LVDVALVLTEERKVVGGVRGLWGAAVVQRNPLDAQARQGAHHRISVVSRRTERVDVDEDVGRTQALPQRAAHANSSRFVLKKASKMTGGESSAVHAGQASTSS